MEASNYFLRKSREIFLWNTSPYVNKTTFNTNKPGVATGGVL